MNTQSMLASFYLIFKVKEMQFGVTAAIVQEIVRLPEISPLEEAPVYIQGLVNLRGKVMPVLDLNLRLGGQRTHPYRLTDALLILRRKDKLLGIIINEALGMVELPPDSVEPAPGFEEEGITKPHLLNMVAKTNDGLTMLLDQAQLFRFAPIEALSPELIEGLGTIEDEPPEDEAQEAVKRYPFFHGMTAEEKQAFRERSQQLQKNLVSEDLQNAIPLAVIRLAGESLAVEMEVTEGFASITGLTPIPCCPPHIMGSTNLRGDSLTVVDVRELLNIPHTKHETPENIIIIRCANYFLGVAIDEVVDVIHVRPESINKVPDTIDVLDRSYLKGMATYKKEMLALVDLPTLLAKPELTVHEEP
ncbi:hypothetical protein TI05_01335 [Achromatium sp. WMS3]|nr:hypothetical protein TI05_01335 [Achromatium sp. WMS3]